jgi:hypothetical protein
VIEQPTQVIEQPTQVIEQPTQVIAAQAPEDDTGGEQS